ncbi:hypothetical protein ABL78_2947 [Leptomonas seymouri]|uniref:Uncharacterized protein n=1 Tax=Leptomonas seymouri TaxID=5684 RepID=A0A0N0P6R8_LEPSE|nr:hypothetical protein ABL78_2947 [Leptomonas seymouri]|eukprot:KPI87956.1 hypothetical protein ABL78_2947 [Leptomonas seymouri]
MGEIFKGIDASSVLLQSPIPADKLAAADILFGQLRGYNPEGLLCIAQYPFSEVATEGSHITIRKSACASRAVNLLCRYAVAATFHSDLL